MALDSRHVEEAHGRGDLGEQRLQPGSAEVGAVPLRIAGLGVRCVGFVPTESGTPLSASFGGPESPESNSRAFSANACTAE